jgi:S-adenosylmethionine decarboxylase
MSGMAPLQELLGSALSIGLKPDSVRYSRASFLFPKKQPPLYQCFEKETAFLQRCFPDLESTAHVLGDSSHGLQWHVFSASQTPRYSPASGAVACPALSSTSNNGRSNTMEVSSCTEDLECGTPDGGIEGGNRETAPEGDAKPEGGTCTLELCMTELDESAAQQFVRTDDFVSSGHTTAATGISSLVPSAKIDDYVFEPCGFALMSSALHCTCVYNKYLIVPSKSKLLIRQVFPE